jgi:hypothetical protein
MKKVLYLMIFMFLTQNSFAQNEVGKISIEPQIGFNVSNLTIVRYKNIRYTLFKLPDKQLCQ